MSDHNPDEYLPVESAGSVAGISPRTLRYWINGGKLPAVAGQRGKLVKLGDVLAMAELTGKASAGSRQPAGNVGNPATSAGMPVGNTAGNADDDELRPAVSAAAITQLEAIRDEWLQPLVDQIRELERSHGRLEEQRDQAIRERDELRAEVELLREIQHASPPPEPEVENAPVSPPEAPGRELPDEGVRTPEHHPSWLLAAWQKLTGRS